MSNKSSTSYSEETLQSEKYQTKTVFAQEELESLNSDFINSVDSVGSNNLDALESTATEFKAKHEFDDNNLFNSTPMPDESSMTVMPESSDSISQELMHQKEMALEKRLRTGTKSRMTFIFAAFSGLVTWQAVDYVIHAYNQGDWLSLGWAGFISTLAGFGLTAIGKEFWKLRRLRQHFVIQAQSENVLIKNSSATPATSATHSRTDISHIGFSHIDIAEQIKDTRLLCKQLAKQAGIQGENPAYERWVNSIQDTHTDNEVLELYDALVVSQQDEQAKQVISQYAVESAALVAVSPLATADMLLVAWRNFKMINRLSEIYGVELGYLSRIQLIRSVFVNMAIAGASELVIDSGIDLLSTDLAGKLSARAGQGLGVGLLTARLGIKAATLLRPLAWRKDRQIKLTTIRKAIITKVAAMRLPK